MVFQGGATTPEVPSTNPAVPSRPPVHEERGESTGSTTRAPYRRPAPYREPTVAKPAGYDQSGTMRNRDGDIHRKGSPMTTQQGNVPGVGPGESGTNCPEGQVVTDTTPPNA